MNHSDAKWRQLDHPRFMRRAIAAAANVPRLPFGAVLVDVELSAVVAEGWNRSNENPTWHGEIDVINRWAAAPQPTLARRLVLYSTAEPCPMCQGAIVWAGFQAVVYGTSIASLMQLGWKQIDLPADEVVRRSTFGHCELLGGILQSECDALFAAALRAHHSSLR